MQWKIPAGIAIALAFMVPAAPAMAQTAAAPGLDQNCQTVERKTFKDIRELFTFDLDTASVSQLRLLTNRILSAADTEALPTLPDIIQERLGGTSDDLRAWLKKDAQTVWAIDLRIKVGQTMTGAGPNVKEAAQKTLDSEGVEPYLAYLNEGLYDARALDCKSLPTPTPTTSPTSQPTPTPSATSTVAPIAATSTSPVAAGGDGGGLPVTGADTATVAGIGGALLLVGGASFVIARRRRARFVA
ncbi:LPXTG cell wall anchor domain-containing protein [Micromonospora sp. NPDC005174]|uniref:LPXTG cell wall anchor domain-containing protein n=1 Tax=Micromonospora sp. NPDC005174 TaxID=3157018 RepID=UPI0033A72D59